MARWRQGDRIAPRWLVLKHFEGGMSDVYVVHDADLHCTLAAKTFKDELFARNTAVAKEFEREAKIWIDLGPHENVAQAFFVERLEGKLFIFLEYISGGDLLGVIASGLTGNMRELLRFAIQICDGMTHALTHGIAAHRDLKPNNCLVTRENTLKVTDFGLAMAATVASPGVAQPRGPGGLPLVVGTMPYMAPEQWAAPFAVDKRADVYAFGVMLYQMITQRPPFVVDPQGKTWPQVAAAYEALHKTAVVPPFECAIAALKNIVRICLEKTATNRYPDFSAIRAALAPIYQSVTGETVWRPVIGTKLNASIWAERGGSLSDLGFYQDAVAACRRAITLNPGSVIAWSNLGAAFVRWGEHEKIAGHSEEALRLYRHAVDACNAAIKLDSRRSESHHNLGLALSNLGQADQALTCFDTAIRLDANHVGTYTAKVNLLLRLHRTGDAFAAARAAIKPDGNSASAWFSLGLVYQHQGRVNEAIDCYAKAAALNPLLPHVWANLGSLHAEQGLFDQSVAASTRALELDPDNHNALSNRGFALSALNRHDAALKDLDRGILIYPRDSTLHLNRARPLAMLGRLHDALTACDEALACNPNDSGALIQKGAIHEMRKDYSEALRCYGKAQDLGDPRATPRTARLRKLVGDSV